MERLDFSGALKQNAERAAVQAVAGKIFKPETHRRATPKREQSRRRHVAHTALPAARLQPGHAAT